MPNMKDLNQEDKINASIHSNEKSLEIFKLIFEKRIFQIIIILFLVIELWLKEINIINLTAEILKFKTQFNELFNYILKIHG